MKRKTSLIAGVLAAALLALSAGTAAAQQGNAPDLFAILSALQRNPAYAGQVLTTQPYYPDPNSQRFLYEVRILKPDDRIVIVYIDPMNGQIVSVSGG
jgi:hypothetical protein